MNRYWLLNILKLSASCALLMGCSFIYASPDEHETGKHETEKYCNSAIAPATIAEMDVVLQIENAVTSYTSGYPYKGAVVAHYKKNGTWEAQGTNTMKGQVDDSQQAFHGTFKYQKTGFNTAIEKSTDLTINNTYIRKYTFETPASGKWEEDFGNGAIKFSGSFTIIPSNLPSSQHLAPETNAGLNVALIINAATSETLPPDVYPTRGLALQTYATDGTFIIKGFGPRTLNSHGTYTFKKIAANTAVEEATQVSDLFTLPYTMVYIFETPTSGKWFQSLGDGFIKFSGTFDTFPNE